jgi:hypothetical protein
MLRVPSNEDTKASGVGMHICSRDARKMRKSDVGSQWSGRDGPERLCHGDKTIFARLKR